MPFSPSDFLRHKQLLPSQARTAEWDAASDRDPATAAWVKERAFFMAGVARAGRLQEFRNAAAAVAQGTMSAQEARRHVRRELEAAGYKPDAGLGDTIKDLKSDARLRVSIDTNVALARGWAQHRTSMANTARPAQELYRAGQSLNPRNWAARWQDAAEAVGWEGVAKGGQMVALKTSPIWAALSRFGNPYPPFDFNSKMRVRSVSLDRCRQLGLLPDDEAAERQAAEQRAMLPSLNENVAVQMKELSTELRTQAENLFQGIAEWDAGTQSFRMTDMNGTRPYGWQDIGRIISAPNPAIGNRQLDAFELWTHDSSKFRDAALGRAEKNADVTLDVVEDAARLFRRINPIASDGSDPDKALHRALGFKNEKQLKNVLDSLTCIGRDNEGNMMDATYYTARSGSIAESWNNNMKTTREYANKKFNVILHCNKYRSRRRIDGIYKHAQELKQKEGGALAQEGESVFTGDVKFRVLSRNPKITRHPDGSVDYEFDVEEA